jgi:hypothetical protein
VKPFIAVWLICSVIVFGMNSVDIPIQVNRMKLSVLLGPYTLGKFLMATFVHIEQQLQKPTEETKVGGGQLTHD